MSTEIEVELAELHALVGVELVPALRAATDRVLAGDAYSLTAALDDARERIAKLEVAFEQVARSRNEWRARAKRETTTRGGFELCSHPRLVPRLPCPACAPRYAVEAAKRAGS
jgi:hypothetical protein